MRVRSYASTYRGMASTKLAEPCKATTARKATTPPPAPKAPKKESAVKSALTKIGEQITRTAELNYEAGQANLRGAARLVKTGLSRIGEGAIIKGKQDFEMDKHFLLEIYGPAKPVIDPIFDTGTILSSSSLGGLTSALAVPKGALDVQYSAVKGDVNDAKKALGSFSFDMLTTGLQASGNKIAQAIGDVAAKAKVIYTRFSDPDNQPEPLGSSQQPNCQ